MIPEVFVLKMHVCYVLVFCVITSQPYLWLVAVFAWPHDRDELCPLLSDILQCSQISLTLHAIQMTWKRFKLFGVASSLVVDIAN